MRDFLSRMADASERRAREARSRTPVRELRRRIADCPAAPTLSLHPDGFDLIAEVKQRSPSNGRLADDDVVQRARAYARAGAAAVSVLTEPDEFSGSLEDLERISAGLGADETDGSFSGPVVTLRKDFLTDPYQVLEARVMGASGVLIVLRIVDEARLEEILTAAAQAVAAGISVTPDASVARYDDASDRSNLHAIIDGLTDNSTSGHKPYYTYVPDPAQHGAPFVAR